MLAQNRQQAIIWIHLYTIVDKTAIIWTDDSQIFQPFAC